MCVRRPFSKLNLGESTMARRRSRPPPVLSASRWTRSSRRAGASCAPSPSSPSPERLPKPSPHADIALVLSVLRATGPMFPVAKEDKELYDLYLEFKALGLAAPTKRARRDAPDLPQQEDILVEEEHDFVDLFEQDFCSRRLFF